MPELRFIISWPDGTAETCYAPSTIVRAHFKPGTRYKIPEFLSRSRTALTAASNRVHALYGTPCSLALDQLSRIEATARTYPAEAEVIFESFKE